MQSNTFKVMNLFEVIAFSPRRTLYPRNIRVDCRQAANQKSQQRTVQFLLSGAKFTPQPRATCPCQSLVLLKNVESYDAKIWRFER